MDQIEKFKKLVDDSQRILITSHISPDPDAISSVLLLGTTLMHNYSDKQISMVVEEKPARDLSFLNDYSEIKFQPLLEATKRSSPELLIILDAMNYERCSRNDGATLRATVNKLAAKVVIIDHHEEDGKDKSDTYINHGYPATAQEVYEICFKDLDLKKPERYAPTALLGIITDSFRFKYDNPGHRQTFAVVSELLDDGASIESLENKIERYDTGQMRAFANLASHIQDSGKGYSFSFIDDEFSQSGLTDASAFASFKTACEIFTSQFVRNFEKNDWGFIVYPELASGRRNYSVSFRSISGGRDVAQLAQKLGGGGHKQAAGAKNIKAASVDEAIQKVQQAITSS